MKMFVNEDSVVRLIWGKSDTVIFIFAGSAAEFALNKAVDWLFYTGKLPADPIGRLFSTVAYAGQIIFSSEPDANIAIDKITAIHSGVEKSRKASIPDWAYRDVLFMLIYYSIASFEVLERKLSHDEKEEVYDVFYRVGSRMNLKELPANYDNWLVMHENHLQNHLERSRFTIDLFKQYKIHLGNLRYRLLLETQKLIVPDTVRKLLGFKRFSFTQMVLPLYKISRMFKFDSVLKSILLPLKYKKQIKSLDRI
jgi:hypothetical protein